MTGQYKENPNWIETFTGKKVDPLRLEPNDISLVDIAHSLSLTCRFSGHCRKFYSVADHSLLVYRIVMLETRDPMTLLAALMHDAAEAYMVDIPRPIKYQLREVLEIERRIDGVVMSAFNIHGGDWAVVKNADNTALAVEAKNLMRSGGTGWELPDYSHLDILIGKTAAPRLLEQEFIDTFYMLKDSI